MIEVYRGTWVVAYRSPASISRLHLAVRHGIPRSIPRSDGGRRIHHRPADAQKGALFLVDESGKGAALAGLAAQQRLGCDSEWLDIEVIVEKYPALSSDRLIGDTFGPSDGSVGPHAVIEGYRRKSLYVGAEQVAAPVDSLLTSDLTVSGPRLADGPIIEAATVVACAGA